MDATDRKTFLLGVGCQKGGTTWLHGYLKKSRQVDLGFLKEYHVFDALDLEFAQDYLKKTRMGARKALKDRAAAGAKRANALRWQQFQIDPESYFDYFHYLLIRDPRIRLTADITPSYAGLSAERLAFIRDGFARRGVSVRVVFLMRDPVERIWSAIRMNHRRHRAQNPDSKILKKTEEATLLENYAKPPQELRTRYDLTIANLERVFASEDIHYEFYERLFTEAAVARLCGFLGIETRPPDFDRHPNASPKSAEISVTAMREVAQHYRPVYESVGARFGERTVADLWPGMHLL